LIQEGRVVSRVSSHVDLMPTILDILDINTWNHFQGESMLDERIDNTVYTCSVGGELGLVQGNYTYMHYPRINADELYDIVNDPDQMKNLAFDHPELINKYRNMTKEWASNQRYIIGNRKFLPPNKMHLSDLLNS